MQALVPPGIIANAKTRARWMGDDDENGGYCKIYGVPRLSSWGVLGGRPFGCGIIAGSSSVCIAPRRNASERPTFRGASAFSARCSCDSRSACRCYIIHIPE
jgi:hypothetical protein